MSRFVKEFTKGLWQDLPPFRLVLGLCPTLAVTKTAENGLGMGLAVIFVLTLSNVFISALRKLIPAKVRIACFIVIAATLVVTVEQLMQAFAYPLYQKLGIFVPLIVVNCIILAGPKPLPPKTPSFSPWPTARGIGLGFCLSLTFLGSLREVLGYGSIFGHDLFGSAFEPFAFMVEAPGAFVCLGLVLGLMNVISAMKGIRSGKDSAPAECRHCGACYRMFGS